MKKTLTVLVAASLIASSCGWRDSRINPTNWFGRSQSVPVATSDDGQTTVNTLIPPERNSIFSRPPPEDTSVPIASVTELQINQTPSGAIILVEGVANRQGAYGAELRPVDPDLVTEDGVLHLEFRVVYPVANTAVGSARTRTVVDAFTVSRQQLQDVRLVRVTGAQNALESRRR